MDPSLISSHLLCCWLPTGCSATRADAANLCGARSPQTPEMRCSYPRMCARRFCAQSQQVVKCWGKLGALGISRARRASLTGQQPRLDQTNHSKKRHICPAQLPAAPCYAPSWHTGSSLHHWNLLPSFSRTAVGETWPMPTLPAPDTRQSWPAGGGSTDPQQVQGHRNTTGPCRMKTGFNLSLTQRALFPQGSRSQSCCPSYFPTLKYINIEIQSQYL